MGTDFRGADRLTTTRSSPGAIARRIATLLAIWTVPAVIVTGQLYVQLQNAGREPSWWSLLLLQVCRWWPWAALTPWLQRVARRNTPRGPERARHWGIVLAIGAALLPLSAAYGVFVDLYLFQGIRMDAAAAVASVGRALVTGLPVFIVTFAAVIGSAWLLGLRDDYQQRQIEAERLRTALAEARLQALQIKLQPHFLFNTLHVVASLMDEDTGRAQRMTAQLAGLLRAVLDLSDDTVLPLRRELELAEMYLAIEQTRFEGRLRIDWEVDPDVLDCEVPTLTLQPLVENAVRHGVSRSFDAGRMLIRATVDTGTVRIDVIDDGVGPPASPHFGVGLSSVQARLQALFGDNGRLELRTANGGGCMATVTVPWSR